jgi:hypothetical protein
VMGVVQPRMVLSAWPCSRAVLISQPGERHAVNGDRCWASGGQGQRRPRGRGLVGAAGLWVGVNL